MVIKTNHLSRDHAHIEMKFPLDCRNALIIKRIITNNNKKFKTCNDNWRWRDSNSRP